MSLENVPHFMSGYMVASKANATGKDMLSVVFKVTVIASVDVILLF